ncbi:hypothetical protein TNCV_4683731 [Trichonephila clavipes]|nr:hypothetical protein TNCV_4683731 [Trichonephila clavipes]
MVSDRGWLCHEFEPSNTKDPPCKAAMHDKYVKSKTSSRLVWQLGECQLEFVVHITRPWFKVRSPYQKPSCS